MQRSLPVIIAILLNTFYSQVSAQSKYTINDSWHFIKDNNITDVNQFLKQQDKAELVNIPHTWNDKDVEDENEGFYRGAGWYTKEVRIPTAYKDKQVFLFFEGVATVAEVYINKQLVTKHVGGFTRFVVPISKYVNFDETKEFTTFNVVVKADNSYNDDIPPLAGDFTFFGGMYRDVNLVVTEKVHFNIEDSAANGVFITTPNVSKASGDLNLKIKIKNDASDVQKVELVTKVYNPQQQLVQEKRRGLKLKTGVSNEFDLKMKPVLNPQLWSPDAPNMYQVVCELFNAKTKQKIDESINPLGFRWFKFDVEKGFFLNGKHLKLIGTNRHQDYKSIGNALPDYIHVEDIIKLKEMGSNFLRISHYPQDSAILEMCDKLGIITTVETPINDVITASDEFTKNCLSAQKEMIRQNFNHPSLIIWAYMNEVLLHPRFAKDKVKYKQYTDNVLKLAQQIEDLTRSEDPCRYTMIPFHSGLERYKEAGLTEVPMVVGWNIYDGWYGRSYDDLQPKLEKFHAAVKKPMIITEYGAGADPRLHTLNPTRFDFTQEYQTLYHEHYLTVLRKFPFVAGANVWNYADFNSEGRIDAVQSINNKGLVGIDRKPKEAYYFYQASLLKKPIIRIATKTWIRRSCIENAEGAGICTMPVEVFTNQKEIELFLNGKSIGTKKTSGAIALFDVPFINGENSLRAVSQSNKEIEDCSNVKINVLSFELNNFPPSGLSINVGDERFFYDDKIDQAWSTDKTYTDGSWGHVGGQVYKMPRSTKQPYGTNQPIAGSSNDPIYQTQLTGIQQYRFDTPVGMYEVILHFAELEGTKANSLPYDLSVDNNEGSKITNRTFSVVINGKTILNKIDLHEQYGDYRAVTIKTETYVQKGKPLIIGFKKIVGEPVLNAIEVYKKL